jgi:hypothetical protein
VLNFLQEYQAHFNRTRAFCSKLKELDLLEPMQAEFTLPSGKKTSLTGFQAINRAKLQALPGDTLEELSKTGELELMYTHLQSMRNFSAMVSRAAGVEGSSESAGDVADAPEPDAGAAEDTPEEAVT